MRKIEAIEDKKSRSLSKTKLVEPLNFSHKSALKLISNINMAK
jgi:hypothetical protein